LARYLDTDNRVLLDIVPAPQEAAPAAPQLPGEPKQPTAPPPQVPEGEPIPGAPMAAQEVGKTI